MSDFSAARLQPAERERLLAEQTECTVSWVDGDGWPVSVIQTYLWSRASLWVTCFRDRARVARLVAEPRAAVAVSSAGTHLAAEQMASCRAVAVVCDDADTAAWFYPQFCRRATTDAATASAMAQALARQPRVIIELKPQSWTTFDGSRLRAQARAAPGDGGAPGKRLGGHASGGGSSVNGC